MSNLHSEKVDAVETSEHAPVAIDADATAQLGHLANAEDHDVGKLASFRKYPYACLWSLYAVWLVLLVSFESQAAGSVIGIPEFRKDFGYELPDGTFALDAKWQSAFQGAPVAS